MITTRPVDNHLEASQSPDVVRPLLQPLLARVAGGAPTITALRVRDVRRSASRRRNPVPLTLRYELDVRDNVSGVTCTRAFYGKVFRDGASAGAIDGTAALHLPQLDMLLWPWPADPGLPQLPALLDPAQTLRWWGRAAQTVEMLRYTPEHRATFCYTRSAGTDAENRIFAKTFKDDRAAAIHRRFQFFDALARKDRLAPAVAQPLGYNEDTRAFWQIEATGVPLGLAQLAQPAQSLAERLAHAIAAVHAAPADLAGPVPRDQAYWLSEIRRRRNKVARVAPALEARVTRVAEVLTAAATPLDPGVHTLIHGDCHPGQMWLDGERIVLFDFDEFALGDPMEDLAAFVVRLETDDAGGAFAAQLIAAYARSAPQEFCARRLAWHRALQQLLQTSRAFVFQVADWSREVERRLARTEALIEALRPWCAA